MFTEQALAELTPILERSKLYRYLGGKWILNTTSEEDYHRLSGAGFRYQDEKGERTVRVGLVSGSNDFMRGETKWFDMNLPVEMWLVCDELHGVGVKA